MNVQYDYAYFDVINFANQFATSGWSLDICPFTFKPRLDTTLFSNKRLLWDFGDGTKSKSITATHFYAAPGSYTVTLYLYDGLGEAYFDAFTQTLDVYNFVPDALVLSASNLKFEVSSISNNFEINRFNSWQTYAALSATGYSISLAASGNKSPFISQADYNQDKWSHLKKYSQFYIYSYDTNLQVYDYIAADNLTTSNTELFARVVGAELQFCNASDSGSTFVGSSGNAIASYKDDEPTTNGPVLIFAHFDNISFGEYAAKTVQQTFSESFYCTLTANMPQSLSITSTGLSSMQINASQFTNSRIPFVVQLIDQNNIPCKFFDNLVRVSNQGGLSANTIQIDVVDPFTQISLNPLIADNFGALSDSNIGIYKAYCALMQSATAAMITANALVSSVSGLIALSGVSSQFIVLSSNLGIAKINENYDQAAAYKSYRFQETLLDKNTFFDGFLGSIVGSASADVDAVGKRIHEKITNFVDNTDDIDVMNIPALYSTKQMLDINVKQFDTYNFSAPAEVSRLMDICSIKQSKLWGHQNEFGDNFDKKGFVQSTEWGVNLGNQLNAQTTILTAGSATQYIVAYERFSNTFHRINIDALSSANLQFIDPVTETYALSSYNDFWGWGLVLPENFNSIDFDKYYYFYEYVVQPRANILDAVINWNDSNTTILSSESYRTWTANNGTIQNLLTETLLTGLGLFGALTGMNASIFNNNYLFFDDASSFLSLDDGESFLVLS